MMMNLKLKTKGVMNLESLNEDEMLNTEFLTFEEMMIEYEKRPPVQFLWNGVQEKSFGLVFGPSKSGKTIFCENMAMSIAVGAKDYMGYDLSGKPEKVLFVGLEEFYVNRAERNKKQFDVLTDAEKELINKNYLYQPIEFSKRIIVDKDWKNLIATIVQSEAKVVFIDSITRMNPGKLEDSKNAEIIMQKLRGMCYDLEITLICIHHTPKMYDKPIIMDSIKGSSVFAQESDFAIGINRTTKGYRYMKNVFFRYAADDDDMVKEFEIDDSIWLNLGDESEEMELISRSDRRRTDDKRERITSFFNTNLNMTYTTKELTKMFESEFGLKERMAKSYLSGLIKAEKIKCVERGVYRSVNYVNVEGDERRR